MRLRHGLVIFSVTASTVALVGLLSLLLVNLEAQAASRWTPGESKDRIRGDASTRPRPPSRPKKPSRNSRCISNRCTTRLPNPSVNASKAEKELILPKPDILVDPEFGALVGTTAMVRVQAPAHFSDYVSADGIGAHVQARPSRAECDVPSGKIGAPMFQLFQQTRASTPPMPFFLENLGQIRIVCRLLWDTEWWSTEGERGIIPDRETWNERLYPVGAVVGVLVR